MKVSCILVSYNRPRWVRQAIKSVADQTHKDYQLIVIDESDIFDIHEAVKEFSLTQCDVRVVQVAAEQRRNQNRLSINLNAGVALATGDLLCYLADDDYFYPTWFERASASSRPIQTSMRATASSSIRIPRRWSLLRNRRR